MGVRLDSLESGGGCSVESAPYDIGSDPSHKPHPREAAPKSPKLSSASPMEAGPESTQIWHLIALALPTVPLCLG